MLFCFWWLMFPLQKRCYLLEFEYENIDGCMLAMMWTLENWFLCGSLHSTLEKLSFIWLIVNKLIFVLVWLLIHFFILNMNSMSNGLCLFMHIWICLSQTFTNQAMGFYYRRLRCYSRCSWSSFLAQSYEHSTNDDDHVL